VQRGVYALPLLTVPFEGKTMRYWVIRVGNIKIAVSCAITPCSLVVVHRRYRGRYCLHNQGKRKIRPSALHKSLLGSGGITPLIFNHCTRRRRLANFTLQPCYLRKEPPVPSKQQAGWTSLSHSGHFREKSLKDNGNPIPIIRLSSP